MKRNGISLKALIVIIIILAIILVFILFRSNPTSENSENNSEETEETSFNWEKINIPIDYSVQENIWFTSEYFDIYYSSKYRTYTVFLKKGAEYEYTEVKDWVRSHYEDFIDLASVHERNIEYIDHRDREGLEDHRGLEE